MYDNSTPHDQVASGPRAYRPGHGSERLARLLLEVLPTRLHPPSALRPAGPARVPQDRLPRAGADAQGMGRTARGARPGRGPRSLHAPTRRAARVREKGGAALLDRTVAAARARGLIPEKPRAAIDATGFETRHVSRYYAWRSGKRRRQRSWPKLTAVLETKSHLYLSAYVSRGPSQDSPQFTPAVRAAARRCRLDTLLGDAGYDAEHNHALGRQRLGIRATVIPLNRRNTGRKWPKTRYRRQMVRRFRRKPRGARHRRVHGQRCELESGFSLSKRRLGSALRARLWVNQKREVILRVVTHNLLLLAAA